jgi:flagellar hook-associated protein 3 FlgL
MRVSDLMTFDRAKLDGQAASNRLATATARASTGEKLVQPGDDPGSAGLVIRAQGQKQRLDAIATSAGRAGDEVNAADTTLGNINTALSRASQIAVQLSSSQYGASERAAGAQEVQGLISTIAASLDTEVGGRYIFGGSQDRTPPFAGLVLDATGNVDTTATGAYSGDTAVRQVEIAPGVLQDSSIRADVALRGVGGGVDAIAVLGSLANALAANDPATVASTVGQLSASIAQVATARSQAGSIMNTLDAAVSANQTARDDATKQISSLTDADSIQAASDLALAQHALQSSLTATSQGFQFSLVNKL